MTLLLPRRKTGPAAPRKTRLAALRIPIPFAPPLEAEVRLTPETVVSAVKGLMT